MRRKTPPKLPELSQMQVLKHYLRLSQENLGADFNVDIGQGTCTMKYSPKVNELFVRSPKVSALHPLQDQSKVQGILEILYKTDLFLREISGLDRFSFQPASGSPGDSGYGFYCEGLSCVQGRIGATRRDHHHLSSPIPRMQREPAVLGYKVVTLYQDESGLPEVESLKKVVSKRTAALFPTNPEDTGIFNPKIDELTKIVHQHGGLCTYDQANANGILGLTRAREAGFDMCFFNLHKTFSSPHGCGGPGCGALGVTGEVFFGISAGSSDRI